MHKIIKCNNIKKRIIIIILLLIVNNLFNLLSIVAGDDESVVIKTVVIDAGHGGKDSGALGKFAKEKDVVLAIALKAGNYIEENIETVSSFGIRKTH